MRLARVLFVGYLAMILLVLAAIFVIGGLAR